MNKENEEKKMGSYWQLKVTLTAYCSRLGKWVEGKEWGEAGKIKEWKKTKGMENENEPTLVMQAEGQTHTTTDRKASLLNGFCDILETKLIYG